METAQRTPISPIKRSSPRKLKSMTTEPKQSSVPLNLTASLESTSEFSLLETLYESPCSPTKVELRSVFASFLTLKRVSKSKLLTPNQQRSAERELSLSVNLDHPNIITLHRAEETPWEYLYLMEYLPKATYFEERLEINNRPFMLKSDGGLAKLKSFAYDILAGLEYLHSCGIVHLDIKPANLLLFTDVDKDEFPMVKICDFGLARQVSENGTVRLDVRCGTEGYIAPEVKDGGYVTVAADLWSFGVFLHQLAFGYKPNALKWNSGEKLPMIKRHWRKYDGSGLDELVTLCLCRDPAARITATEALNLPFFL